VIAFREPTALEAARRGRWYSPDLQEPQPVGREKRSESRRSRITEGGIRRCAAAPALHALINPIAVIPAKAGTQ